MSIKVEVLNESPKRIELALSGCSASLVNSLRRAVISQLEAFAISEIDFYENTSPMFNEYIANRIGLIPLTYEDNVEDDAKISFSINVEAVDQDYTVISRDLKSTDEKIKCLNDDFPIIKLGKGQRLRLEGIAVKGMGKQHARFQSALASYASMSDLKKNAKEDEYWFFVESFNNLTAMQQFQRAVSLLEEKVKLFKKQLK